MVMKKVPFELIIGAPALTAMRTSIDLYHQTVTVRHDGQTEILSLEYEPEFGDDTEDDFTSDTEDEKDIGEDSEPSDTEGLVLVVNSEDPHTSMTSKDELIEQKLSHVPGDYQEVMRYMLREYQDILAESSEEVRPSNSGTVHKFELTTDEPVFQKLRRVPPAHNEVIRKEIDRMLRAGIITPVESSWKSSIVIV